MPHPSQLIPSARQHRLGELSQEPELINDDPAHEAWRWSADADDAPPGDGRGPASHISGGAAPAAAPAADVPRPEPTPRGRPARRAAEPDADGEYDRLREETLRQCDADYATWRRERFAAEFDAWRRLRRRRV